MEKLTPLDKFMKPMHFLSTGDAQLIFNYSSKAFFKQVNCEVGRTVYIMIFLASLFKTLRLNKWFSSKSDSNIKKVKTELVGTWTFKTMTFPSFGDSNAGMARLQTHVSLRKRPLYVKNNSPG